MIVNREGGHAMACPPSFVLGITLRARHTHIYKVHARERLLRTEV